MNTIKKAKKFSSSDEFCGLAVKYLNRSDYGYELRMFVKKLANIFLNKIENKNISFLMSDTEELEKLKYKDEDLEALSPLDWYFYNNLDGNLKVLLYKAIEEEITNITLKVYAGLFRAVNQDIFLGKNDTLNNDSLTLKRVKKN